MSDSPSPKVNGMEGWSNIIFTYNLQEGLWEMARNSSLHIAFGINLLADGVGT
jgi:hypothetical protein